MSRAALIALVSIASCGMLFLLLQVLEVHFFVRIIVNLLIFGAVPFIALRLIKHPVTFLKNPSLEKKSIFLGVGVFLAMLLANVLFKPFIDTGGVVEKLTAIGITLQTYVLVSVYVIVFNSFLEEVFFRGFNSIALASYAPWAGYFSAALFSVYHVALFSAWFSWWVAGAALIGLCIGGLIFNWLNLKSQTIYNSWFVHGMADLGIIVVGLNWFGVL